MSAFLSGKNSLSSTTTADLADAAVTEAKIANDAISLAELKAGTDGELITWDASGNPTTVAAGTSGHLLKSQGAGSVPVFAAAPSAGFTLSALQATTSGTSVTFGSIPTGIKQVVVMFSEVRFSAGGITALVQIGDSGGIETSGYTSGSQALWTNTAITGFGSSAGFNFRTQDSTSPITGTMTLNLQKTSTFKWVQSHAMKTGNQASADNGDGAIGGGAKALSAELTQLKISGGTFTHGAIAVMFQ